jgi:hypothetical protein
MRKAHDRHPAPRATLPAASPEYEELTTMPHLPRHARATILLALAAFASLSVVASAAAAQPWLWTPRQAASALKAQAPSVFAGLAPFTVKATTCAGVSPATAGRYDAFACTQTLVRNGLSSRHKAWLKVRHAGTGTACISRVSLAKIPSSCLAVASTGGGGTKMSKGSPAEAETAVRFAMQRRMDPSKGGQWQGFTRLDCTGSNGLYQCAFGDDISGTATIYFTGSGPVLYWTTLMCSASAAALYPGGCKFP